MPYIFSPVFGYDSILTGLPPLNLNNEGVYICGILQPNADELTSIRGQVDNVIETILVKQQPLAWNSFIQNVDNIASALRDRMFLPLDVGETSKDTLQQRIRNKFCRSILHTDVLFDYNLSNFDLYIGIAAYNIHWIHSRDLDNLNINVNINIGVDSLLFMSSPVFLNQLFPGITQHLSIINSRRGQGNVSQSTLIDSIVKLYPGNSMPSNVITFLRKFMVSQVVYKKYYAVTCVSINQYQTKSLEGATKWVLEAMGLFTTKHLHGHGKKVVFPALSAGKKPLNDSIDLRQISGQIYNPLSITDFVFPV